MQKGNRIRSRQPRTRSYWCGGCDRNIVLNGQPCGVCGKVQGKLRDKKPSPMPEEE